jgi:sulfite exporter TauE/SafE
MCGPFLLFAVSAHDQVRPRSVVWIHASYHLGRLVTYTLLGVVAGLVGQALEFGGAMLGIQRTAAILAGTLMVGFGVVALARALGQKLPRLKPPAFLQRTVQRGHRVALDLEPAQRALVVGLLTTLLPCGWLYAFAITAAGTASPIWGGLTMAVFWSGTLPVMITLGVSLGALAGPFRRHVPLIAALVVVVVGISTIFGRLSLPVMTRESLGVALPAGLEAAAKSAEAIDAHDLPCCAPEREP